MSSPSLPRSICLGGILLVTGACGQRDRTASASAPPPPSAEFLVATQDSTFWVTTAEAKIHARGASITLAQYDGRFFEIYLADDDRSYAEALLVGFRLYRRDLQSGDSALVFEDSIVPRVAREYHAAHPDAHRLLPDEEGAEEPATQAMADLQVVNVHGPYLSFEYHVDVSHGGRPWHATRRGVIDLRSGRAARISDLFPSRVATALIDSGRHELASAVDSLRGDSREGARRAFLAVSRARFDERSFVLTVPDSQLAIEFDVPQLGTDVADEVLPLDALRPSPPAWWPDVARNFANAEDDLDRWRHGAEAGYNVIARYDSAAETARIVLTDRGREWPVRVVTAPILHLFWLDQPAVATDQRKALARAFDEASLYDETTRTVRDNRRRAPAVQRVALRAAPQHLPRHRA